MRSSSGLHEASIFLTVAVGADGRPTSGTAFTVGPRHLLTAAHCCAPSGHVTLFAPGRRVDAYCTVHDTVADVALLEIVGTDLDDWLELGEIEPTSGAKLTALQHRTSGSVRDLFDRLLAFPANVGDSAGWSYGVDTYRVRSTPPTMAGGRRYELDGVATEGDSGSPLLDADGTVVGMILGTNAGGAGPFAASLSSLTVHCESALPPPSVVARKEPCELSKLLVTVWAARRLAALRITSITEADPRSDRQRVLEADASLIYLENELEDEQRAVEEARAAGALARERARVAEAERLAAAARVVHPIRSPAPYAAASPVPGCFAIAAVCMSVFFLANHVWPNASGSIAEKESTDKSRLERLEATSLLASAAYSPFALTRPTRGLESIDTPFSLFGIAAHPTSLLDLPGAPTRTEGEPHATRNLDSDDLHIDLSRIRTGLDRDAADDLRRAPGGCLERAPHSRLPFETLTPEARARFQRYLSERQPSSL